MSITSEKLPKNLDELKEYILNFNTNEQVTSTETPDPLDFISMSKSGLYTYVEDIQSKIQPLRYKYNRLLSSLATLEFDDNSPFEEKKTVFLSLRDEIMAVLKSINELNHLMAPLQSLINKIIEENPVTAKNYPQTLNAIPLPQSTLVMPKTQQLKTPNYEITSQPIVVNPKSTANNISHSKKGSINTPSAAVGSASNANTYNNPNTIGSSGKRRSTKSTPQSISPYVNMHSAGPQHQPQLQQQHNLLQQQMLNSNNNTPSYMNTNPNNINTNTMMQNSSLGLKSLSPEDVLKQSNLNTNNSINNNNNNNNMHSNNRNSVGSNSNNNANSVGSNLNNNSLNLDTNSLNLNFDFDNFDDFLK
ncbi:hypothetical protein ACO0SA_002017 [Hanseniaspora valbyensis]